MDTGVRFQYVCKSCGRKGRPQLSREEADKEMIDHLRERSDHECRIRKITLLEHERTAS